MAPFTKSKKRRFYPKKYYSEKRKEILEILKSKSTPENRKTSNKAYYENVSQKGFALLEINTSYSVNKKRRKKD